MFKRQLHTFVHLQVHSYFSFLRGTNSIEELCAATKARRMQALALTEINGLYGLIWFLQTAKAYELTPIIGAELVTETEQAVLLAKNINGYQALSRVLSTRHLAPENFSLVNELDNQRSDLVILSASVPLLQQLKQQYGPEDLYVAVSPGINRHTLLNFSRESGIPPVATNNVMYVDPVGHRIHRLIRAIDLNTSLSRLQETDLASRNAWLKSPEEMAQAFPDCPEALENTWKIAERCTFDLNFGKLIFPESKSKSPLEPFEKLKQKCYVGALERYGRVTSKISARMEYELKIIREKGFANYFLVVEDIVRRSPRTCGRGSAAASLVSYCLGITHVDPIQHDLFFERFLNMGRKDPPDIDVDFAWDERDDVLKYVFQKYGTQAAAMISNHVTLQGKACVREVAKVYGLPEHEINALTKRLRGWDNQNVSQIVKSDPIFKNQRFTGDWVEILMMAEMIHGFPRHLSVHCGGVVIAPDGLSNYVPLERAAKGVNVIQWEKDQAEDAGLVKIDLLGNRSLAVIRDALKSVQENYGTKINYSSWNPVEDPKTRRLIREGETMGVFYVESPAMRQLQKKAGKDDFDHLVIHSSIIRPAANPYIQEYLKRLKGKPWQPLHPLLAQQMQESYGIMVYQEDVAKTAIALAGFDPAEADELRKTLSKKNNSRKMDDFRQRFFEGAICRGVELKDIKTVWQMILSFSGYSFCKPHSASYALVSFKSAYLRAHYPAEFMAAVISNGGGYYSTLAYLSESRRMGLTILPLDINLSQNEYIGHKKTLRVGFMQLKGITHKGIEALLAERDKNGKFRNFDDFLKRVAIDPNDIQILVKSGTFDSIEPKTPRPALIWKLKRQKERPVYTRGGDLPLFDNGFAPLPSVTDYDAATRLKHEIEVFGYPISQHPLSLYQERLRQIPLISARHLAKYVGKQVNLAGWLVTGKLVSTKNKELMEFFSFEDQTAIYETTFFPKTYQRFCHLITDTRPFILNGLVETNFGSTTLNVLNVKAL